MQHRGQECAGIVSSEGGNFYSQKGAGCVSDVFNRDVLDSLPGSIAIGHVRYSTTGSSTAENSQPIHVKYKGGRLAIAHNGNLTNSAQLKSELESRGAIFLTNTDSELLLHLIAHSPSNDFEAVSYTHLTLPTIYSV